MEMHYVPGEASAPARDGEKELEDAAVSGTFEFAGPEKKRGSEKEGKCRGESKEQLEIIGQTGRSRNERREDESTREGDGLIVLVIIERR
jgi:hypothetical protein